MATIDADRATIDPINGYRIQAPHGTGLYPTHKHFSLADTTWIPLVLVRRYTPAGKPRLMHFECNRSRAQWHRRQFLFLHSSEKAWPLLWTTVEQPLCASHLKTFSPAEEQWKQDNVRS
ncbi:hypothetical protein HPP92_028916 [Vanilla planifolia]|uniref:Uncharacterized protein n=1 Tax=Vanilla planifolia TaxID=51239 RepID=A0A835U2U2_VANPL|nr:hypothetical protein HPP92_028916 [Vanilla planifolia]KAG0446287.1 hypothetical protein HPP92_028906 [Vanilla planifolia]